MDTHANRLAQEKSPYLLQHARNPVEWYPWGKEAFAKARAEDKPIFLSVGYSTCHWCHVMARESFENPAIAAVMNELFVNVKVDREERPDVDRVYMTFVQATVGSGGWPMSVWLQPDLKPIFGGTYFPPDDRYGRRGFAAVCRALADAWTGSRDQVLAQSNRIVAALQDYAQSADLNDGVTSPLRMDEKAALEALDPYTSGFDRAWGGFGHAPKFPRPVILNLLARIQARLGAHPAAADARRMMLATLDKMAAGGMHDHLGGGFHRYSVDRFWHVPHFEKMLYDQAQLAVAYLEAFQITGDERHVHVVRDILDYVRRDLTSEAGGFYSAEDADSSLSFEHPEEHAEGAFYVWTRDEIGRSLTAEEARVFCLHYGVEEEGNAPDGSDPQGEFTGKNILIERQPVAETAGLAGVDAATAGTLLKSARSKLFVLRDARPRPHRDDKILTAWNGLMISAFARAYQVLGDPAILQAARRAADFIRQEMYSAETGTLRRSFREGPAAVDGFADDYAFLIQGLLDLYEAGFEIRDLLWAQALQKKQDELFLDPAAGGYFGATDDGKNLSAEEPALPLRIKEDHDGAEPSASSISALNLGRLAAMLGNSSDHRRGLQTVAAFTRSTRDGQEQTFTRLAQVMPALLSAMDFLSQEPQHLVLAGAPGADNTRALARAIGKVYGPNRIVLHADGGDGQKVLVQGAPYLEGVGPVDGRAAIYPCQNGACQLPITDPAAVRGDL